MLFPTFDFLVFVVPVLLAFWALGHRPLARVLLLLIASYFFYMAGPKTDPPPTPWYFAGLLVFSTVLDFVCGHQIDRRAHQIDSPDVREAARARRIRNVFLGASLVGNLGLLGYFKYVDFFVATFTDIAHAAGFSFVAPHIETILPIGISFYTFQSLSYTIDVWRGRLRPEPSFAKFALFVTFFPQLVAGPIVRASELLPQLHHRPRLDPVMMEEGLFRIFKGLVKKVVLGDWIAAYFTDAVFANPQAYTSMEILLALYAFTVQLYADFSGYSDIAIGTARLLGFQIPENFDRPYQAKNLGEFWRRWHMTLSTWLRDYLFFPLGGSRGSTARTYFNLWLTMFLVGMWHYTPGTSWNFVIYSNIHGLAMLFSRWNRTRRREGPARILAIGLIMPGLAVGIAWAAQVILDLPEASALVCGVFGGVMFGLVTWLPLSGGPINTFVHVFITYHFTVLSRVFFRAPDFPTAKSMVAGLLRFDTQLVRPGLLTEWLWLALALGTFYHFTPKRWIDQWVWGWFRRIPGPVLGVLMGLLGLALMKLMAGAPRTFIYFNF
ncbi:MAG: MBOAT family protein [Deltaproteobacteria bacterium]|nr:MBOAT family protein [Deltaproteobacteria bacterium]